MNRTAVDFDPGILFAGQEDGRVEHGHDEMEVRELSVSIGQGR